MLDVEDLRERGVLSVLSRVDADDFQRSGLHTLHIAH